MIHEHDRNPVKEKQQWKTLIETAAKPAAEDSPALEAEESSDGPEARQESKSREEGQTSSQEEQPRRARSPHAIAATTRPKESVSIR